MSLAVVSSAWCTCPVLLRRTDLTTGLTKVMDLLCGAETMAKTPMPGGPPSSR